MQTFNPKTDESKSSTSYHMQIPKETLSQHNSSPVKGERISDVYLKDTSDVMQNLDTERQAIMNDTSLGINQKIVTLQSLQFKPQQERSSAYSTIQISDMQKQVEDKKKEALDQQMQEAQTRIDNMNDQIELENIQESFS